MDTHYASEIIVFSHDDGDTLTAIELELEFVKPYSFIRTVTKYYLPATFDKEQHGAWQMELVDQLKAYGYSTEEI